MLQDLQMHSKIIEQRSWGSRKIKDCSATSIQSAQIAWFCPSFFDHFDIPLSNCKGHERKGSLSTPKSRLIDLFSLLIWIFQLACLL
jgi:hypothetical protein